MSTASKVTPIQAHIARYPDRFTPDAVAYNLRFQLRTDRYEVLTILDSMAQRGLVQRVGPTDWRNVRERCVNG